MSKNYSIIQATMADRDKIIEILQHGRQMQIESGNLCQWDKHFPSIDQVEADIQSGVAFKCVDDRIDSILGVFSLFHRPDPTYKYIDGQWLNDAPYVTIHRLASSGQVRGVGQYCLREVIKRYSNVRIDTHEDNAPMRHILDKLGFKAVGTIYLANGAPRLAFHYCQKKHSSTR